MKSSNELLQKTIEYFWKKHGLELSELEADAFLNSLGLFGMIVYKALEEVSSKTECGSNEKGTSSPSRLTLIASFTLDEARRGSIAKRRDSAAFGSGVEGQGSLRGSEPVTHYPITPATGDKK